MSARNILVFAFLILSFLLNAQGPKLVCPIWHGNDIKKAQFSPDQKMILTLGEDRLVKIWSAANGELLQTLEPHIEEVLDAVFSPDSKKILTSSKDSTLKLWDIASGTLLYKLPGFPRREPIAKFSIDGKMILTSSTDHLAILWDAASGKQMRILELKTTFIPEKANFSPDGKYILLSSSDSLGIWETASGKFMHTLKTSGYMGESSFSPDGKLIVSQISGQTPQYIIWESESSNILYRLEAGKSTINPCLQFSSDNGRLIGVVSDSILVIWNMKTGEQLQKLMTGKNKIASAGFSPKGETVLTASRGNLVRFWETASGQLIDELKLNGHNVLQALYSPDGKRILLVNLSDPATVWDTKERKQLYVLSAIRTGVSDAFFSPNGEYFFSNSSDIGWKKWETTTGRQKSIPFGKLTSLIGYSKDGTWLFYVDSLLHIADPESGKTQYIFSWDVDTWKYHFNKEGQWIQGFDVQDTLLSARNFTKFFPLAGETGDLITMKPTNLPNKKIFQIAGKELADIWDIRQFDLRLPGNTKKWYMDWQKQFSPNNNYFLTTSDDERIVLWDAIKGTYIKTLTGHTSWPVFDADFSRDGKWVVSGANDKMIIIWDISTGVPLFKLPGHLNGVRSTRFSRDGSKIISSSLDGQIKIWDIKARREIYSFLIIDTINFFQQIPTGYYQTTPAAAKLLHYVTKDLKVITFEQLDVKYNRPDKVLEAIGNTDTALIRSYKKAWEKRIKKLGIDTTAFRDGYSVPECDFVDRDTIDYEQKNGMLSLHIKGMDSTYKLDRFNVWINEAPLFGQRGISIKRRNKNDFDTTVTVKLSQGENRIETSIINVNGTESYRMPLVVNYTPVVKEKESLHFIGIGMDKFADSKYNLQYSSKDIRDLSVKLKQKYGAVITIDTLFNENVSVSAVKALKQKLFTSSVNDKVIVAYSGHGMLSKDYDYYLSTWSVNFDKPEENGLPYDELENLLDSIPARKKLMLIDACHSGEVDKDDLVTLNASSDSLIKGLKPVAYKKEGHLGLKNSFELMQSLFVNVGKSTGATIISAAAGTQFALERNDLKNGVFTYSILEAMNKYPTLKISELKKIVGERVEELTKGLQKPTSRNENIAVDWELW